MRSTKPMRSRGTIRSRTGDSPIDNAPRSSWSSTSAIRPSARDAEIISASSPDVWLFDNSSAGSKPNNRTITLASALSSQITGPKIFR